MDPIVLRFFIFLSLLYSTHGRSKQSTNVCKHTSKDKPYHKNPCIPASPQKLNSDEPPAFDTVALNCSSNVSNMSECIWHTTNKNFNLYLRFAVPQNKTGLHEELFDLLRVCPFLDKPALTMEVSEVTDSKARLTWTFSSETSMADLDYEVTYAEQTTPWIARTIPTQKGLIRNAKGGSILLTHLYEGMRHDVVVRATASASWLRRSCQMKKIDPGEWSHSVSTSFHTKRSPLSVKEGTFSIDTEKKDSRVVRAFWKHVQRRNERCSVTVYEEAKPVKTGVCDNATEYAAKISNKAHRIDIRYTNRNKTARHHSIVIRVPEKGKINSNFTFAILTNGTGRYQLFWPPTNVTIQAKLVGSNSSYLTWISNNTATATFYVPDPVIFSMSGNSSGLKLSNCILSNEEELINLEAVTSDRILFVTWSYACPRLLEILAIEKMLLVLCKTLNYECIEGTSQRYTFSSEASDIFLAEINPGQSYKIVGFGLTKHNTTINSNEFHFF